jgi:hypothetical protein
MCPQTRFALLRRNSQQSMTASGIAARRTLALRTSRIQLFPDNPPGEPPPFGELNHPGEHVSGSTTRKAFVVKILETEDRGIGKQAAFGDPRPRRGAKVASCDLTSEFRDS